MLTRALDGLTNSSGIFSPPRCPTVAMPDGAPSSSRPIPGPRGRFLLGNLEEAQSRPLEYVLEVTREYGDLSQVRLGPSKLIIVNAPELVKHVLQEKHANYGRPAFVPLLRRVVGNGLLFSEGDYWLRQRRIMQPTFHRERIAGFARTMAAAVERRVETWLARPEGGALDMSREMQRLSFEIVGRALFSTELDDDADALGAAIRCTLAWLNERTVRPIAPPLFVPTASNRRFRAAQRLFASTMTELIAERRSAQQESHDLLSMLLAARDPDTGVAMTDTQLRDEILTFLIAGYETTSAALEWILILLARHPGAAKRIRAEHGAVCGSRAPSPAEIPRMPYTRMVIEEALRLYPPVFGLSRRVIADDELRGHRIPKGAQVLVSPYAMHRSPTLWEHPEEFDPDRFTPEIHKQRHRHVYIPFGAGPRLCIGSAFAMMELQVLIPTLTSALHLELDGNADIAPQTCMTLRPKGPVTMRVYPA